jgi:signal transduction histidine kinase
MLHEFLTANREALIARCSAKMLERTAPGAGDAGMQHGIPLFLEQLVEMLLLEQTVSPPESRNVAGASEPGNTRVSREMGRTATKHGNELLQRGFTVDQLVHGYGDLCQAVTGLALEKNVPVTTDEFRTLNRCLDNAIADAVTEFGHRRDNLISSESAQAMGERLGSLAHELRNLLNSAMLAVAAMKGGDLGMKGATGGVLDRSLLGLRKVIDRSLADVRLAVGMPAQFERIGLAEFIAEVQVAGIMEAKAKGCALTVCPVERGLAVHADREMLSSAVSNLLQNAFKFTRRHTHVSLRAYAAADRVLIEIEDQCGGLPGGTAEKLFRPFEQNGADRTGLGLGLSITQRSVEANGGAVQVRDLPGTGCIFTIDLPLRGEPRGVGSAA